MPSSILRLMALAGVAGTVAAGAPAAQAMDVRVGDASRMDRVAVSVPVTVSCSPFDSAYTFTNSSVSVSLQQAAGRDIAYGSAFVSGGLISMGQPTPPFACDGAEHTVSVV